jgi:AmmeMemoRadiSam system protein B/AmmeMemoRadiSam system protein A
MLKQVKIFLPTILILTIATIAIWKQHRKQNNIVFQNHLTGWYSTDQEQLNADIDGCIDWARKNLASNVSTRPKVVLVPHAGHKFSGLCAASVYSQIKLHHEQKPYTKIVILTPSHASNFENILAPDFNEYAIPTGKIKIDQTNNFAIKKHPLIKFDHENFATEHSLEVQLPFLLKATGNTPISPFLVGKIKASTQANAICEFLSSIIGENDLLLITSDLTHYGPNYDYSPFANNQIANIHMQDAEIINSILHFNTREFARLISQKNPTVCGRNAIKLMLQLCEFVPHLKKMEGRLCCYYTSLESETWPNFWPVDLPTLLQNPVYQPHANLVTYAGLIFCDEPRPTNLAKQFSDFEKALLKKMTQTAVEEAVRTGNIADLKALAFGEGCLKPMGAFVTLKNQTGNLRGCTGKTISNQPLYKTIASVAHTTCLQDNRFRPVTTKELATLSVKLSILSLPTAIESYKQIKIGSHGIILEKQFAGKFFSALFLPEVALENGWNLEQTLENLCLKAGLPPDAWQNDCSLQIFESLVL